MKKKKEETPKTAPTKTTPTKTTVKEMLPVTVDGQSLTATFKQFSTGSLGWNISGKVIVDGAKCQVSGNIVIIGSKPK